MKKALSVILALVMLSTCFAVGFAAFAAETETCEFCHKECTGVLGTCTCCALCEYVDTQKVIDHYNEDGEYVFCCDDCNGVWPCNCYFECGCEACAEKDRPANDGTGDEILSPDEQVRFVSGFQKIMYRLNDIFNKIFDALFELLKLDGIFGK